jgi:hypothetical protein
MSEFSNINLVLGIVGTVTGIIAARERESTFESDDLGMLT